MVDEEVTELETPQQPAVEPADERTISEEAESFRFDPSSTATKGRYKLRDAAAYELNSMYRKRDKYAGRDGIALQMGRHEETHIEEVVAILFDRDKISELEAGHWWVQNKHRFFD